MEFAETSEGAWRVDSGLKARARALAKDAILGLSSLTASSRSKPAIRCLYGHAVFADCAEKFEDFIIFLRNRGQIVSTEQLCSLISTESGSKGENYFHMSFDDGFANVYEVGGKIMEKHRVPYTIFVSTDLVGADPARMSEYFKTMTSYLNPIRTMNWEQVAEAAQSEYAEIGCHTRTHARLSDISSNMAALRDEIQGAKSILEEKTGKACTSFAWPYGTNADIDSASISEIKAAGFTSCFSAVRGRVVQGETDVHLIPRHQVEFHWKPSALRAWAQGFGE
ncbi:MAG TPA: polysaccharide deacetylase family protein [Chakrabartia sp.]|nr:polysaccharide deacetylase family protein [Chakrabartia sp.]